MQPPAAEEEEIRALFNELDLEPKNTPTIEAKLLTNSKIIKSLAVMAIPQNGSR